jgi:hypothetical protein
MLGHDYGREQQVKRQDKPEHKHHKHHRHH